MKRDSIWSTIGLWAALVLLFVFALHYPAESGMGLVIGLTLGAIAIFSVAFGLLLDFLARSSA
jgi:hypothetical protein